jgi:hypothetical protein
MTTEDIKKQCGKSITRFEQQVLPLDYIPNGILLWEGFAFCTLLDLFSADLIIESGIAGGRSTEMFARYFPHPIIAIDNAGYYGLDRFNETANRLSKYHNVKCLNADSIYLLPKLIKQNPNKKIAIFIDGPKGNKAIRLAKKCFSYPRVKFVGIHDQCKDNYHQMDSWPATAFYSDASWFLEKYSYLDKKDPSPELQRELSENPNGPGVGFAINNHNKQTPILLELDFTTLKAQAFVSQQIAHAGAIARKFSRLA